MLIHSCIFDSLNTIHVNVIPYNRTVLSLLYRHDTHQFLFFDFVLFDKATNEYSKICHGPLKITEGFRKYRTKDEKRRISFDLYFINDCCIKQ